jgi:isopentenyl-diphosphate Delta-isomerase
MGDASSTSTIWKRLSASGLLGNEVARKSKKIEHVAAKDRFHMTVTCAKPNQPPLSLRNANRLNLCYPPTLMSSTQILIPAIASDGSLYPIEKLHAHETATLHLAISIFVFSGGELLIQRRALSKYHCGGTWANTCCSHPHWGESLDDAAHRRLKEELGFDVALSRGHELTYQAEVTDGLWEHERVQVYYAHVDKAALTIDHNPTEVCDIAWVGVAQLAKDALENPDRYAPWFRIYLVRWTELGVTPE